MSDSEESTTPINNLEKWLESYGPRLFLFAQQQTNSHADAQDVYQEAIVQVLRESLEKEERFIPPLGRVFIAIKHRAIDLHRKQETRNRREVAYSETAEGNSWFIESIEADETHSKLKDAVGLLPKEQQEVVVLKIWGEQTFRSIADILGIPQNTAASRFRYGIAQLRSSLNLQVL